MWASRPRTALATSCHALFFLSFSLPSSFLTHCCAPAPYQACVLLINGYRAGSEASG